MIKSNHHREKSGNPKLSELINQGKIDPKDISLAIIKAIHEHWKHKPFKPSQSSSTKISRRL
jgi:hypothetical protein